ncbi:hypothetical protein ACVWZZ_002321 [Bradyrhizobium sp. LM6.10]
MPGLNPLRPVWGVHTLGNDALVVQLAGGGEKRLTVSFVVLAIEDRLIELVLLDQLLEQLLPLDLRLSA